MRKPDDSILIDEKRRCTLFVPFLTVLPREWIATLPEPQLSNKLQPDFLFAVTGDSDPNNLVFC